MGIWCQTALHSGRSHAQSEVQVFVVEKNARVETADSLEGSSIEQSSPASRSERGARGLDCLNWLASHIVPSRECLIANDSGRIDDRRVGSLQEHAGYHLAATVPSVQKLLDEIRFGDGIVIQEDQRTVSEGSYGAIQGLTETEIFAPECESGDLGKTSSKKFGAAFLAPIVGHDHRRCSRLGLEGFQARSEAMTTVEGRDVHGRG